MLTRLLDRRPASREALAFAVVGSIGFGVDAGGLAVLFHGLGWGHYSARAASFLLAVTVTYFLNVRKSSGRSNGCEPGTGSGKVGP